MDEKNLQEIFHDFIASLEAMDTQNSAISQYLKEKGVVDQKELAPYLERAGNASSVRWLGVRVRLDHLFSSAMKSSEGESATEKDSQPKKEKEAAEPDAKPPSAKEPQEQGRKNPETHQNSSAESKSNPADDQNTGQKDAVPATPAGEKASDKSDNPDKPDKKENAA